MIKDKTTAAEPIHAATKQVVVDEHPDDTQEDQQPESTTWNHDDDLTKWRERRKAELKEKKSSVEKAEVYGSYDEISQDEFLNVVTKAPRTVCHFYQDHFERCKIFDMHLKKLSLFHPSTRFVKLNACKAPFFVSKLRIRTLPTIVLLLDGVAVHHVVGFHELGGVDDFTTRRLERLLKRYKLLLFNNLPPDALSSESNEED